MNMFAAGDDAGTTPRYALFILAALCLVLVGYGGLKTIQLVSAARTQALAEAGDAITAATAGHIRQDRVPNRLIEAAQSLVADPELGLNYVTVRNADHVTLVSRGRFSNRFGFLGAGTARSLRGWDYRLESAETVRTLDGPGNTSVVGHAQFGVGWLKVFGHAGVGLIIWLTTLLAGLVGLVGALVAGATQRQESSRNEAPVASAHVRRPSPATQEAPDSPRSPLSRFKRGRAKEAGGDEFEPIRPVRSSAAARESASAPPRKAVAPDRPASASISQSQPASPSAVRTPAAASAPASQQKPATPSSEPAVVKAEPSTAAPQKPEPTQREALNPQHEPAAPGTAPETTPKPEAPARSPRPMPDAQATASERASTVVTPAQAELHAPRLDAEPHLGDATLDLRFYPIWRDVNREVLAGACAALAWRTPETRLVDADTLTRLAEQKGALRAFTQWIARRFSLLHSNWRTLEINTVPIVLPIPSAMLAFADAEAVWRDALRRTDRDPNDLILRLISARSRRVAHSSLPVRRALTLADHDKPVPADCDVACIDAAQIGPDIEAWFARIEQLKCPVLLGPVADPEPLASLIDHNRVLWFSDDEKALYSPRAFARLLTRCSTHPI